MILGACATLGLRRGGVDIDDSYIQIHPGTKIAPADEAQLDQILGRYKTKLYKIKGYADGKLAATNGRLNDIYIEQSFLAEVAKAETNGVPYSTLQIGADERGWHPTTHSGRGWHPAHGSHPAHGWHPLTKEDLRECREMVRRVTPILKKYSRD